MAAIKRRVAFVKGLQTELNNRIHRVDDIVTDATTVDGTAAFDDKFIGANAFKVGNDLKIDKTSISNDLALDSETNVASSKAVKALKDLLDGLSGGVVYKGGFDASAGTLPADVTKGWLYKVTVAGTIDGLEMEVNDTIYANVTKAGATAGTDFDKIDNTESADLLRDADVTTEADWTLETTKLSDRATIKTFVEAAVADVSTKFINETGTVASDTFTLANQPLDNCLFTGVASINNGDGTFDVVECTVDAAKLVTLAVDVAGDYDGLTATVTYAYNA